MYELRIKTTTVAAAERRKNPLARTVVRNASFGRTSTTEERKRPKRGTELHFHCLPRPLLAAAYSVCAAGCDDDDAALPRHRFLHS